MNKYSLLLSLTLLIAAQAGIAGEGGRFQRVETETLDEQAFVFPDDLGSTALNIVMLAMSEEQDNGTLQGDQLVEWYAALQAAGVFKDSVRGYHFSVMKAPFFVKGLIRGGLADSYAGKLPADQAGAIFVKDLEKFASEPGITLDGRPTVVLVSPDGEVLEYFKGTVSPDAVAQVRAAVDGYLAGGN